MDDIILIEGGCKVIKTRIRQGLKPLVRIEVRRWKHLHVIKIQARLDKEDAWQDALLQSVPTEGRNARDWDRTALEAWGAITGEHQTRFAYLTQLLSHLMYIYEVQIEDIARKRDLIIIQ